MKANKNTLILIFLVLLVTIGAVLFLGPKKEDALDSILQNSVRQGKVLVYFSKSKGSESTTEAVMRPLPKPKPKDEPGQISFAINELLKGPSPDEQDAGYYSEIPKGTRLLSVKQNDKGIELDLSEEFIAGGGSNSMVQRLEELTKTVVSVPQNKPIYLSVEGKRLETLGGEGVVVNEPINENPDMTQ